MPRAGNFRGRLLASQILSLRIDLPADYFTLTLAATIAFRFR
ncbi:MAG: hypothetical protein WA765_02910 [Candidatus Acidiferrum sp.]